MDEPERATLSTRRTPTWDDRLTIRLAGDADVPALRVLINDAYRELGEMGLNFTGTYQDEDVTRERMAGREVYLALLAGEPVATVSVRLKQDEQGPLHYIGPFAVRPDLKRQGIGHFLLDLIERKARERGINRLQLDTAIPARHLVAFYERRGFVPIREEHWDGKTYRSYIMEKKLGQ